MNGEVYQFDTPLGQRIIISTPTLEDVEGYRRMQAASWLDTYPNEAAGVTHAWVKEYTETWFTPERLEYSFKLVKEMLEGTEHSIFIAKDADIYAGMVTVSHTEQEQELEAIYVDKKYHGTGIAQRLIDIAFETLDLLRPVKVNVVTYNDRARRFYERNGFVITPGSEHLYREKLPTIDMLREGNRHEI